MITCCNCTKGAIYLPYPCYANDPTSMTPGQFPSVAWHPRTGKLGGGLLRLFVHLRFSLCALLEQLWTFPCAMNEILRLTNSLTNRPTPDNQPEGIWRMSRVQGCIPLRSWVAWRGGPQCLLLICEIRAPPLSGTRLKGQAVSWSTQPEASCVKGMWFLNRHVRIAWA